MARKSKADFLLPLLAIVILVASIFVITNLVGKRQSISRPKASLQSCTFSKNWGSFGSGEGQFDNPGGVTTTTSGGNVWVADADNHRIQKFTSEGNFQSEFGSFGTGDGQFDRPFGIVLDESSANRYIYVADTYNNRIQKFNIFGGYIDEWGRQGSSRAKFDRPWDVDTDSQGNVYVADTFNHRIQKFTTGGKYITEWGSLGSRNGQFNTPSGIAIDAGDNVYITDYLNHRVQKFDSEGNFIASWGNGQGSGQDQFNLPLGIDIKRTEGAVYVADTYNHRIKKYDTDGRLHAIFGSEGAGDGQYKFPRGVGVDDTINVFVSDAQNNRIVKSSCPVVSWPIDLSNTHVREAGSTDHGIKYDWEPATNDTESSLFIWNSESCLSYEGGYDSGDLIWSYPTTTKTTYTYYSSIFEEGKSYCGQIWTDFYGGVEGSNPSVVTIPLSDSQDSGDCNCGNSIVRKNNCAQGLNPVCVDKNTCVCQ
ncbi:MAG: hypothetical protein PVJ52_02685 [Candidatus Woesebacteria bacterium]|jgi:DNA-binding beta-propeller fold protein YncE